MAFDVTMRRCGRRRVICAVLMVLHVCLAGGTWAARNFRRRKSGVAANPANGNVKSTGLFLAAGRRTHIHFLKFVRHFSAHVQVYKR